MDASSLAAFNGGRSSAGLNNLSYGQTLSSPSSSGGGQNILMSAIANILGNRNQQSGILQSSNVSGGNGEVDTNFKMSNYGDLINQMLAQRQSAVGGY